MNIAEYNRSKGFTLTELLVVMAIIVVLAALVFLAIGKATLAAHKAESLNNIRALSAATMTWASDHNGQFTGIHSTQNRNPYWFSVKFRDEIQLSRRQCYSSANRCWKNSGWDICQGRDLWDWPGGTSSVWGYICLVNDNGWADSGNFMEPDNWESIKDRVTEGDRRNQTIRWVPDRMGEEVAYPIMWMDLAREYNGGVVANFMKDDTKPRGTHVGYMDGHVEWVRGEDMKPRFKGSATLFW